MQMTSGRCRCGLAAVWLAVALVGAGCAGGDRSTNVQPSDAARAQAEGRDTVTTPAGVSITGSVTARRVEHKTAPDVSVRLYGTPVDTLRVVERTNLPDSVKPGVVYRDVQVTFEYRSVLDTLLLDSLLAPHLTVPDSLD